MLSKFYKQNYLPKNITVVLVGDYGEIDPKSLIEDAFRILLPILPQIPEIKPGFLDYKTPAFILSEQSLVEEEIIFSIQPKKITKPRFALSLLKNRLAF